jgi:micrococcal nuclease
MEGNIAMMKFRELFWRFLKVKRITGIVLSLLVLLVVVSCSPIEKVSEGMEATITRVVDGDTAKVSLANGKEETVRLLLIDTPETKHPRLGVQPFGKEASAYTEKTLENKQVTLEFDVSERDRYGRILAYVWIDDQLFNKKLVEKGLARVAVYPPDTKYVDEFRTVEKEAQKQEVGIWSMENYVTDDGYNVENEPDNTQKEKRNCSIKGNISSSGEKIYHMPSGQYYKQTKPEEWFCTEKQAEENGYRASKR